MPLPCRLPPQRVWQTPAGQDPHKYLRPDLSEHLAKTLRSDLIRFYQGQDIIGSEIGAAAKNVMGIAAGLLDGFNFATLKGGLMARGAREISRLIKACGGNEFSAYGLCHLGDYEATLFSKFSHNRMWGEMFAKGEKFEKLAEGVATSSALLHIANQVNVDLPITQTVYDMIHGNISKDEAIKRIKTRASESWSIQDLRKVNGKNTKSSHLKWYLRNFNE